MRADIRPPMRVNPIGPGGFEPHRDSNPIFKDGVRIHETESVLLTHWLRGDRNLGRGQSTGGNPCFMYHYCHLKIEGYSTGGYPTFRYKIPGLNGLNFFQLFQVIARREAKIILRITKAATCYRLLGVNSVILNETAVARQLYMSHCLHYKGSFQFTLFSTSFGKLTSDLTTTFTKNSLNNFTDIIGK